jgi:site-specific DNA-methyltransferase (adenine-specific)
MYNSIFNNDCLKKLKEIKTNSIDLIIADPPYFLSNGGKTIKNGKIVSVDKGEWDKAKTKEEQIIFTEQWIGECKRILKTDGTIFIMGTHHNIFDVYIFVKLGLKKIILNLE